MVFQSMAKEGLSNEGIGSCQLPVLLKPVSCFISTRSSIWLGKTSSYASSLAACCLGLPGSFL